MTVERLRGIAEELVDETIKRGADQAEASAFHMDGALTRFANSQITQNVASKVGGVIVRAVLKGSVGVSRISSLDPSLYVEAVEQALSTAKLVPSDKNFRGLPEPKEWTLIEGAFDPETAECLPERRAQMVDSLVSEAHDISPLVDAVAGHVTTGLNSFAVANSLDVSAHASYSLAQVVTVISSKEGGKKSASTASDVSRRVSDLDPVALGREAAEKSVRGLNPSKLEPGVYEAILLPLAGAVALSSVMGGFSARTWQSGASFVKHHLGEQVFDEKLNVVDDPRDPNTVIAIPVDGEGVPKGRLEMIAGGVPLEDGIVYDSYLAGKEGKESTGHAALPVGRAFGGGGAGNIVVAPGDASVEEMIAETKRGVLITQFWYNAGVSVTDVVISGLTRNGTFLVEDGEVVGPVMNLRYTDSMLSALKEVPMISKELKRTQRMSLPTLKLERLRFTGATEY